MGSFAEPDQERRELLLKRQALQVAGMLPDDPEEALVVLNFAKEIIQKTFGINDKRRGDTDAGNNLGLKLVKPQHQRRGCADGAG